MQITVEMPADARKPYLGAYRHKFTGTTYEHATAQTDKPPSLAWTASNRVATGGTKGRTSAQAQTMVTRTRGTQNVRECGTQMARPSLLLGTSSDRIVTPGKYTSADDFEECAPPASFGHAFADTVTHAPASQHADMGTEPH